MTGGILTILEGFTIILFGLVNWTKNQKVYFIKCLSYEYVNKIVL